MSAPEQAEAVLVIWHDVVPESVDDYRRWHTTEHLPERVSIPGFRRGRRWAKAGGDLEGFCAHMGLSGLDVLTGPDYLARHSAPTPWTMRLGSSYRNFVRCAFAVRYAEHRADGGLLVTARVDTADPQAAADAAETVLRAAVADGRAVTAIVGVVEPDATRARSVESAARSGTDETVTDVVVIAETTGPVDAAALDAALREALAPVAARIGVGTYSLEFDLRPEDARATHEANQQQRTEQEQH